MRIKNRNTNSVVLPQNVLADHIPQQPNSYEGESLLHLLNSIQREMKLTRLSDESLPHKVWLKQQFSIGVNDVTRVLERMPPVHGSISSPPQSAISINRNSKASPLQLQAPNELHVRKKKSTWSKDTAVTSVDYLIGNFETLMAFSGLRKAILIATDCNPRGLTKHLPILASSREVPVIFVKDKKGGSFKLGEIVNLKTAMAIGVKARGNSVNKLVDEILGDKQVINDVVGV